MGDFWVGVRGDLTAEQIEALKAAGIVVYDLRRTAGGWGEPPIEWETPADVRPRVGAGMIQRQG